MNSTILEKIYAAGMDPAKVTEQLENFKNGFPFLSVDRAATIGDGIIKLESDSLERYINVFDESASLMEILKFVPASGAASRMFKALFSYLEEDELDGSKDKFIQKFIEGLDNFGFKKALSEQLKTRNTSLEEALLAKKYHAIVDALLNEEGLNYGNLPKGLLDFHDYGNIVRTPVQEHLAEAKAYGKGKDNKARLHFTVSPEHMDAFRKHLAAVQNDFEIDFEVEFSTQKKSTDTIAVDLNNEPFILKNGQLLFRPAGHGALLENLNDISADIIFIKNIDNVVPDGIKSTTIEYKKALGGLLISIQKQLYKYQSILDQEVLEAQLTEMELFAKERLLLDFPESYSGLSTNEKIEFLKAKLNRPIRICGMVKNTGEPGGGPFWVNGNDGASLQIAETSQLDLENESVANILNGSTHFNPVDLVCSVKNYKGEKYDLLKYRDPNTGFITQKSKEGRELKALELPGLWNGAMANWITLFVEVPLITFNPVKTVNDLLRKEHQA